MRIGSSPPRCHGNSIICPGFRILPSRISFVLGCRCISRPLESLISLLWPSLPSPLPSPVVIHLNRSLLEFSGLSATSDAAGPVFCVCPLFIKDSLIPSFVFLSSQPQWSAWKASLWNGFLCLFHSFPAEMPLEKKGNLWPSGMSAAISSFACVVHARSRVTAA